MTTALSGPSFVFYADRERRLTVLEGG